MFTTKFGEFDNEGFKKRMFEIAANKMRAKFESVMPEILKEDPEAIITTDENNMPVLQARMSKELAEKIKLLLHQNLE